MVYESFVKIERNVKTDMNVFSLSKEFGFSLYYFSRLFKAITGVALKEYIMHRKMYSAYQDLLFTDKKIIEIAFDYGFNSHESFSRAFQKITGTNPSELRQSKLPMDISFIPQLTKESIENPEYRVMKEPELIELSEFYLVGIPFYHDIKQKNDLSEEWGNLIKNKGYIPYLKSPERYYQMQYWFSDDDPETFCFFVALEVESPKDIPIQFTTKTIPQQNYLKFQHKGRSNEVGITYDFIYRTYLPETNYKLPHLFNFEYYGPGFKGPYNEDSISEIFIPVERS